jgi:mono/diheme cytochrome c family protein
MTASPTFAVLGLFDSPDALMAAIPKVKAQQLGRLETYTPYPIHGLDEALELRQSPLGGMVLGMGILGALTALGFEYWISAVDYPIVTGGKAPWSWEAFVPIMFEVMVAFATFTAGLGMLLLLNKLPFFGHPVLNAKAMRSITRDRFALAIEADPELDAEAAKAALIAAGASDVEVLPMPDQGPFLSADFVLRSLGGIFVACVVAGLAMYGAVKLMPVISPVSHMLDQPRVNAQQASSFFADGRAMRMPVPGTVARGILPLGPATQEEAASMVNPLPRTPEVLALGRQAFTIRCAVCHGPLADGLGSLGSAFGAKPANLQAPQFLAYPDGKIYWVIMNGKNAMPSQGADLTETQRWAVVHYVRALQRAQNAKDEDIP